MIVSIELLREFVDIAVPADELADLLTNLGLESDVIFEGKALDIEITPNRPDCMSHVGVAREIAVLTGSKLTYPEIGLKESTQSVLDLIDVEIEDPEKCPRYACRVVKNVTVVATPSWMKNRLETVGLRSINSVVDVSNYVLMELGHPLHTFDLERIAGGKIVVRSAKKGETLRTLDGEDRTLDEGHLLICDAESPVALAGIMGGENSEVSETTRDVLIESAYFDPITIRKGSKSLGLRTEASKRFERGADYEGVVRALDRTALLIAEIAGGEILNDVVDRYPSPIEPCTIQFETARASRLTGIDFDPEFIRKTFRGLEISFSETADGYECRIPTFRPDITRAVDLTEELSRIYGYDRIKSDLSYDGWLGANIGDPLADVVKLKQFFAGLGFNETVTNSLLSPREANLFAPESAVKLQNPLSREMSVLRASLFPGLLASVAFNLKRGEQNLAFFEYGDTFVTDESSATGCLEQETFSGVICGLKNPKQWREGPHQHDFFALKGYMKSLCKFLKINNYQFVPLVDDTRFALGQALTSADGESICEFGMFPKSPLRSYDIDIDVFGFDLNLERVRELLARPVTHTRISPYPGISRDLSFIVQEAVSAGNIESLMKKWGSDVLKKVSLYDLYEGEQVDEGCKSLTFNLFFQRADRTLTDKEVDKVISTIISKASRHLNAKLR